VFLTRHELQERYLYIFKEIFVVDTFVSTESFRPALRFVSSKAKLTWASKVESTTRGLPGKDFNCFRSFYQFYRASIVLVRRLIAEALTTCSPQGPHNRTLVFLL